MKPYNEILEMELRILKEATDPQHKTLQNDYNYGSRASFWYDAHAYQLCSREELDRARNYYGSTWNYRGD